ncbi:MAG TPA: MbtH family NRPS accessory protein [Streptosporangiaceae bacterium]|nr:MbtH family NRPS accessory protein [Streptosporangiaceae bacterium]
MTEPTADPAEFEDDTFTSVFDRKDQIFSVVVNDEEQYSIWPDGRELPAGWTRTGFKDLRDACLAHIDEVWVDMRPASLRRWMESAERGA